MADISQITLPSGTTYDIKDTVARQSATGGITLRGTTTTALTDEATTNPITINGNSYTAVNQDAVFYGKKEFVFDGTMWHEFGDMSGLGDLALKDSASGSYTPAGSVAAPTITVTPTTDNVYSITDVGTLPELTMSVSNENLTIGFSAGSLPTKGSAQSVMTAASASSTAPTFTGTADTITVT